MESIWIAKSLDCWDAGDCRNRFDYMTKKYVQVQDKIPLPSGGFVEAVRMALIDLSCFGEGEHLDLTGYPHEDVAAALYSDWSALGVDFRAAARKVLAEAEGDGNLVEQTTTAGGTTR